MREVSEVDSFKSGTFSPPPGCVVTAVGSSRPPMPYPPMPYLPSHEPPKALSARADGARCTPAAPEAGTHTFQCFEAGRQFTVSVPPRCAGGGCGLVVDTHGWAMDSAMEERNTAMRAKAGEAGFVVLQGTAGPGVAPNTSWGN